MNIPATPWLDHHHPNPVEQFREWFTAAEQHPQRPAEPSAMALATAGADGAPSVRMVLLKSFDDRGFVFYTNYESRKAKELEANPRAALLFWWECLHRQVRIEGTVHRIDAEESDAYFAGRPRESQIGAWSSPQSSVIHSRRELDERYEKTAAAYEGRDVPRPPFWGGYRLAPRAMEFWLGGPARRHHRLRYRLEGSRWVVERLAP